MREESDYKLRLVRQVCVLPGGHARRIEDRYSVGVLDLWFAIPGIPQFWAEGKLVEHQSFGPTPRQYLEGRKLEAAGVRALLLGFKGRLMAVSAWRESATWADCVVGSVSWETNGEFFAQEKT